MQITEIEIEKLSPYKLNAKLHPATQIQGIAESIRRFGFTQPIVVDKNNEIIIGHGRLEAAKIAGLAKVPCLRMDDLTEQEVRALRLIDNRIAETGWDVEMLQLDIKDLEIDLQPFNIDFGDLFPPVVVEGNTDPDAVPPIPTEPKSKIGDVYQLGDHRLICGDSTSADVIGKLLGDAKPHLMVTDPPYGVEYDPEWRNEAARTSEGMGNRTLGAGAVGKVLNDDKADWREAWALFPGDVAYVWHAGLYAGVVADSLIACGFVMRSQIIWDKTRLVIGRGDYHWHHEPCWYAVKKGKTGHYNGDRKQTTMWPINHQKSETGHGTQKPVECMKRPIENNSKPGEAIYDPFSGSGTTLIACEMTGRKCFGVELNPVYVDVIVKRWEDFTGKKAVLLPAK